MAAKSEIELTVPMSSCRLSISFSAFLRATSFPDFNGEEKNDESREEELPAKHKTQGKTNEGNEESPAKSGDQRDR